MTQSPATARAVLIGLAVGALCSWWMLRSGAAAPPRSGGVSVVPRRPAEPVVNAAKRAKTPPETTKPDADPPAEEKPAPPPRAPIHVELRVEASEDETPIVGARVFLSDAADAVPLVTDAAGTARFDATSDGDGPPTFRVTADGRVAKRVEVAETSRAEPRMVVVLWPSMSIEGVVHGADGAPIAGARVVAEDAGYDVTPYPEIADARSDERGRFRFDGLPRDRPIQYEVAAPGHVGARRRRDAGDSAPLDVALDSAGRVHAVVRTPDGKPAVHAWVKANTDADAEGVSGSTDAAGTIELDGLALGVEWTISATHDDFMESADSSPIRFDAGHVEASCDVALRPTASLEVDLDFAKPHEPSIAKLHSRALDTTCAVPGKATIVVRSPGTWGVDADVQGLARGSAETQIGPGETKTLRIRFEEGASLAGIVVDDVGAPVAGAVVNVDEGKDWAQQGVSASDGAFRVTGLLAGKHVLKTHAQLHGDAELDEIEAPGQGLRVAAPRFGEIALRLVLPAGAAKPTNWSIELAGADVDDRDPWNGTRIVTAAAPGTARVHVTADDYVAIDRDVEVSPGLRTDVGDVPLDPGVTLTGRVVDAAGAAVVGVSVSIGTTGLRPKTDATGAFVAAHVPAGEHDVEVDSIDFEPTSVTVVAGKDAPTATLRAVRVGRVRAKLVGASGAMLRTLFVQLRARDSDAHSDVAEFNEEGVARLRAPAGKWRASIRKQEDDTEVTSREVDLEPGKETSIEIALPK